MWKRELFITNIEAIIKNIIKGPKHFIRMPLSLGGDENHLFGGLEVEIVKLYPHEDPDLMAYVYEGNHKEFGRCALLAGMNEGMVNPGDVIVGWGSSYVAHSKNPCATAILLYYSSFTIKEKK